MNVPGNLQQIGGCAARTEDARAATGACPCAGDLIPTPRAHAQRARSPGARARFNSIDGSAQPSAVVAFDAGADLPATPLRVWEAVRHSKAA
jgi:hypothetical protein